MSVIDIEPDAQGKVRDLYDLGDRLLVVASDRISAFDYILEDEIPHKGPGAHAAFVLLVQTARRRDREPSHLADVADRPERFKPCVMRWKGGFMLVKKADMYPIECIVRGYLCGQRS